MIEADGFSTSRADEGAGMDIPQTPNDHIIYALKIVHKKSQWAIDMLEEGKDDWYPLLEVTQALKRLEEAKRRIEKKRGEE